MELYLHWFTFILTNAIKDISRDAILNIWIHNSCKLLFPHKDSNLNCLNQNQKCYRYTIGNYIVVIQMQKYKN